MSAADAGAAIELRDYQHDAVKAMRAAIASGSQRILLASPTGSGKTVMFSYLAASALGKGKSVLIVAHRRELVFQISQTLTAFGVSHSVLLPDRKHYHAQAQCQVASLDTLRNVPSQERWTRDVVVLDEAHHVCAASYQFVVKLGRVLVGATATPYRYDGKSLKDHFDVLVEAATLPDLVARGYLAVPKQMIRSGPDLTRVAVRGSDYEPESLGRSVMAIEAIDAVVASFCEHAREKRALGYAVSIEHAEALCERFIDHGIPSAVITGRMGTRERDAIVERFRLGDIPVLWNCMVVVEGFDVPDCEAVILARPTRSRGLWRQMTGRGLRRTGTKTECLLLDHGHLYALHGSVLDPEDLALDMPVLTARRTCESCGKAVAVDDVVCPHCGVLLPSGTRDTVPADDKKKPVVRLLGDMVMLDDPAGSYARLAETARSMAEQRTDLPARTFASYLRQAFRYAFRRWPTLEDQSTVDARLRTHVRFGRPDWVVPVPRDTEGEA